MKFKVGDKVKVRQWDDMAREYGMNGMAIAARCSFMPNMRKYCGKVATVEKFTHMSDYRLRFDDGLSFYIFFRRYAGACTQ